MDTEADAAGGRWSDQEKAISMSISKLGLHSICKVRDTHVRIMADNTTALAYVTHQGGVRSQGCQEVARLI